MKNLKKILEEVHQRLITYEQRFSANDSTSELMAVNQQAGQKPVSVHPELYQLIALGKKHSCDPASHFECYHWPTSSNVANRFLKMPVSRQKRKLKPV